MSDPVTTYNADLSKGHYFTIQATSNSSLQQRVKITINGQTTILAGEGEGKPMTTQHGGQEVTFDATNNSATARLEFDYFKDGKWNAPRVKLTGQVSHHGDTWEAIGSEDGSDDKNNDTYVQIWGRNVNVSIVAAVEALKDAQVINPGESAGSAEQ